VTDVSREKEIDRKEVDRQEEVDGSQVDRPEEEHGSQEHGSQVDRTQVDRQEEVDGSQVDREAPLREAVAVGSPTEWEGGERSPPFRVRTLPGSGRCPC
jgi:hypothetical protein